MQESGLEHPILQGTALLHGVRHPAPPSSLIQRVRWGHVLVESEMTWISKAREVEDTVQVIDLVLQDAREQSRRLARERTSVTIEGAVADAAIPRHIAAQPGN